MKHLIRSFGLTVALVVGLASLASAQTAVTQTTLAAAVNPGDTFVTLTSATGVTANITGPTTSGSLLFVDREAMLVISLSGTVARVQRGYDGTFNDAHANLATVYAGQLGSYANGTSAGGPFVRVDPGPASCTSTNEVYSVRINTKNGMVWKCSTAGQWINVIDTFVFVPPSACATQTGNSSGTNQVTTAGASFTGVAQASSSSTGTNTHTYSCVIPLPQRLDPSRTAYVVDALFFYGVQTTGLGTQVATLASGTMNSLPVFSTIAFPVAGATETASTVTPVRADAGTLVITPVVASSNVATTTAGAFYSIKFAPATAFALNTDGRVTLLTASFLNTATSATVTNSPGFIVHYQTVSGW